MNDLYKEALMDAKKIKEVAEIDAKNRIMEQLSPVVKDMISKEIKKNLVTENFFTEQDDDSVPLEDPAQAMAPTSDPSQELSGDLGNQPASPGDLPIQPSGTDLMNMTVPDSDGKIVVDFDDLFVPGQDVAANPAPAATEPSPAPEVVPAPETAGPGPEASAELPADAEAQLPPTDPNAMLQPESVQYNQFKMGLLEASDKIDRLYFRKKPITSVIEESMKTKLFSLMEQLDKLSEKGIISIKESKTNENKLDFLYLKLKEAVLNNSYNKTQEENNNMASLKEFAAQLFEEDEKLDIAQDTANSGKTGVPTDKEKSKHAATQSGVSPEIGGPADLGVASEKTFTEEVLPGTAGSVNASPISDKERGEKQWSDAEPPLDEKSQASTMKENSAVANTDANEDVAKGAAGFGDTNEDPAVEFEIDEKELKEALLAIRKENIQKKIKKLKESKEDGPEVKVKDNANESWEDADPEGGKEPALKHLEEQLGALEAEESALMGGDDVMDVEVSASDDMDPMMAGGAGDDMDLVLSVDLPDELEAMLADLDSTDFGVDVSLGGDMGGEDDMLDIDVEDEGGVDVVDATVEGEDDGLLLDDEPASPVVPEGKQMKALQNKLKLAEASLAKARNLLEQRNKEKADLEAQIQETYLFTAKTVYLNKFLMREGLSKKVQRQIVEHLDKATTVAEAKVVYNKIKTKLNESVATSQKLGGSSSKVATPGSVKLNENSQPEQTKTENQPLNEGFDLDRWKKLAKIK